jgi:hypothetical protein
MVTSSAPDIIALAAVDIASAAKPLNVCMLLCMLSRLLSSCNRAAAAVVACKISAISTAEVAPSWL